MTTASEHITAVRAKRVLGTIVTDTSSKRIGYVEDIILDKQSNNILFAVVASGGFLGMGEKYHSIPWGSLHYDSINGSYIVRYTKKQLQAASRGSIEELTRSDSLASHEQTIDYLRHQTEQP